MRKLIQGGVLAAFLLTSAVEAGQKVGGGLAQSGAGVTFDCEMPLQQLPSTGFYPLRFRIGNDTRDTHTWRLSFSSGGGGSEGRAMTWSTSLTVAGGQAREWDLLIPRAVLETSGSHYEFVRGTLRGYGVEGGGNFSLPSRYIGGSKTGFVVMSDTLGNTSWSKLEAEIKTTTPGPAKNAELVNQRMGSSSRSSGRMLSGSPVIMTELPADWRAFSGFAGLWLTQRDWEKLTSEMRRAIRTWISMGGHLFIGTESGSLEQDPLLPANLRAGAAIPLGLGEVKTFKLEAGELPVAETAREVLNLDGAVFPAWHRDFNNDWRFVEQVGWPQLNVALIIGFVCIFGLVIGPINLRLLAPPEKRHRLFLTVPLLSVGASVILGLVISVGDGFGGLGGRNALVYLPVGESQAFIAQEQIARTRLLLGRSFQVPETVQLAAAEVKRSDGAVSLERFANYASGDWFKSRSVQMHALRGTVPTRAEVSLQAPSADGSPVLLSSIGASLQKVFYIDPGGKYWRADQLETGRPTPLKESTKQEFQTWQDTVGAEMSDHMSVALSNVGHRAGYFYATATSLPEAPIETLPSIKWEQQNVICFGPCVKGGAQ